MDLLITMVINFSFLICIEFKAFLIEPEEFNKENNLKDMFSFLSDRSDYITRGGLKKIFYDDLNYKSRWNSYCVMPNLIIDKKISMWTPI
jgi:hypothetical protein